MSVLVENIRAWSSKTKFIEFKEYGDFLRANQADLLCKVGKYGLNVRSVWNLVNPKADTAEKLPEVIDILIDSIDDNKLHPAVIDGVIRTLGRKEIVRARDLYDFLNGRYLEIPPSKELENPQARGIDNAFAEVLSMHFTIQKFANHKALILNENLGDSRILLLIGLSRNRDNDEVERFLHSLVEHPVFHKEIAVILKKARKKGPRGRG